MKHNLNRVLSIVALLMIAISTWAGEVVIFKNPSNGGTVVASEAGLGETCTLTVTPTSSYYLKSLKAVTTVSGGAIQAPIRRAGTIDIDETELTITSDESADPSGETTHTFTMPADGNLNVEVTAVFEARINISDAVITLAEKSFTYDGTAKEPAVSSVVVGGTTLNANEFTISYSNNISVSDAASPTVTITGLRKYTGTATETFTILAKSITSDMITLTDTSFEYDGQTHVPGVTVADGNTPLTTGTDFTISYQVLDGETAVEADDTKDAATYNVVITGNGNYTGSATKSFVITKAQLKNLSVSLQGWTYGAQASEPVVEGNEGEAAETFYYKTKDADDETYTTVVPENAGNYTVKVQVAESANYASASATADFTISKAVLTGATVTLDGWTYGATANEPVVQSPGNGVATFTYKGADEEDTKYTETVPVNAGNYTVKATIAESNNYQSGTATADFSIAKADLEGLPSVAADDLEYNGTEQVLLPITVPDGVTVEYFFASITEEDYKGSYDPNCAGEVFYSTTIPKATNAGYFAIIYKVDGGNNYNNIMPSGTIKVAIYPAEITEVTIDKTVMEYTGEAQTVTITSVKAGNLVLGTNDYTVKLNDVTVTGNITAKDVNEYTVAVTGQGNFTGTGTADFSIVNHTLADNEVEFYNQWATYYSADGDVMLPSSKTIGAYVATSVGDGVVTVSQISYIPEGVAVLLNNATETVATEAFDVKEGVNLMKHATTDVDTDTDEALFYGLHNGTMMRVSGTIPAGKNYLYLPLAMNTQNAPQLTIVIDGEATGVNDVRSKKADVSGDVYDMQGRKVQKPSKKGLYISNGQKVVVK